MSKLNRYPGPKPFSAEQARQFHGRETEAKRLLRMVQHNQLTVLYGRSGYGKSSLLNAAVLPHLEAEAYHIINVRMGAYTLASDNTPLRSTVQALAEDRSLLEPTILDDLIEWDNSLWYYTKTYAINSKKPKLLFVFDQFEELFTYPAPEVELYENGLAELIRSNLPQRYSDELKKNTAVAQHPQRSDLFERMDIKVIIAIRSNRFHLLERLAPSIPQVLQNTMELDALEREGARRAIIIPARDTELAYNSPAFDYSPAAQEDILDFLTQEEKIEGILLQILCTHFERMVARNGSSGQVIDLKDINLPNPSKENTIDQPLRDIIDTYYFERIDDLPDDEEETVKRFIEDSLVQRVGNGGMRLSLHQAQIKERFDIEPKTLKILVDNGLLRTEPFLRGGVTYELTHDRLLDPVLKAKAVYEADEAQRLKKQLEEEEQKRKEAEKLRAEAVEARKQAEAEQAKALEAEKIAQDALKSVQKEKEQAEIERAKALVAQEQAQEARLLAEEQRQEAEEQRQLAITAQKVAEEKERRAKDLSKAIVIIAILTAIFGVLYYLSRIEARQQRAEQNLALVQKLSTNADALMQAGYCESAEIKIEIISNLIVENQDIGTQEVTEKYKTEAKKLVKLNEQLGNKCP
ncbi:MAG: hypothetical protein AAGJ93_06940 [Bacteroidota bacterium]